MKVNKCMSCIPNNEEEFKVVVGQYQETLDTQTGYFWWKSNSHISTNFQTFLYHLPTIKQTLLE